LPAFLFLPVAQGKQPSEDRGNNNSAAENVSALNLGTTGFFNTAHGWFSLFGNTTGSANTADGFQALLSNTTGDSNTAMVLRRSLATPPATATRPWVLRPCLGILRHRKHGQCVQPEA
jgi:hypothetical protein